MTVDGHDFHLGYSRVAKYLGCPKSYKFTYVDGIRSEGKTPQRRGNAYHDSLEQMLQYKLDTGQMCSLPRAMILAEFCAHKWKLPPSEVGKVQEAVAFYHSGNSPDSSISKYAQHQPVCVEDSFEIVRGGVKLTGRLDLFERDGFITDHKFSADVWAEGRARYGCQPMIYQWAGDDYMSPKYGVPYAGFRYNIIRTWPSTIIQTIQIDRLSQDHSDWWEEQIACIATGIRNGIFPANSQEKECKWCDHKKICKPCIYDVNMSNIQDNIDDFKDC